MVRKSCTDLKFNIYSPHDSETICLYADGPCGTSPLSTSRLNIQFQECTCPIGLEPLSTTKSTRCDCVCDSALSPYVNNCSFTTGSLLRVNTNSWISYVNSSVAFGFLIHSNCPFDYCLSPTMNVSMNLNLPDGVDAQCAFSRRGILCGACQQNFNLSLGTSSCLPCHKHWRAVFLTIVIAASLAGILLVVLMLASC